MKVFFCVVLAVIVTTATAGLVSSADKPAYPLNSLIFDSQPDGRITNGKDAAVAQFPYQVGLNLSVGEGDYWCGGILIANDWVLTAAHCTSRATSVTILFGSTELTSPLVTQTVDSSNFIIHPNFNYDIIGHDISLIKISPVTFSRYINKVRLPALTSTPSTYDDQTAIVSGWGLISDSANKLSPKLQYAILKVISNSECATFYPSDEITADIICTSSIGGTSTCNGDSGGPLTEASTGELIGIFSFLPDGGCAGGGPPGYTRVTDYLEWIKQNSNVSK